MSTREIAYGIIDSMNEDQLEAFLNLFSDYKKPNEQTAAALKECDDIIKNPQNYKGYGTAEDMIRDILS